MIHYMTTQGVGDAWVGNELRIMHKAKIPVALHALMRPEKTYFTSPDIAAMADATHVLYPLSKGGCFRRGCGGTCPLWPSILGSLARCSL